MEFVWLVPATGGVGLIAALLIHVVILRLPAGDGRVAEIADAIRHGAVVYLQRQYAVLAIVVAAIFVGMVTFLSWQAAFAFVLGAGSSAIAGVIGMLTATRANSRTAVAANSRGISAALSLAFLSGSVMGLTVASVGLLSLGGLYLLLGSGEDSLSVFSGFGMGASLVALFARVGGGIFTKSADVGADLVGKLEADIPEDDPRNPGVIADNVGDNVGDVAGMGADIFESYCGSIIAALAIASVMASPEADALGGRERLLFLPFALAAVGLLVSIVAIGIVQRLTSSSPAAALRSGIITSSLLFVSAAWGVVHVLGVAQNLWWAVLAGALAGIVIGLATEYFTRGPVVQRIAEAGSTGAATVLIAGLAVGMQSIIVPVVALCATILVATSLVGLYGVAMAAVGMLATVGIIMAVDAYGPVADNAGGIAEMSGMGSETRAVTDKLDELGNTTAAIGKGFAVGAAALTALALVSAFVEIVGTDLRLEIVEPLVLVGMFFGGTLPFLFTSLTLTAVGDAASEMVEEIRRQFREIPGLLTGTGTPDHARCIAIATDAALKRMPLPALIALAAPLGVGFGFGAQALAGMLVGALLSGVLLALLLANAGAAWDNAKKYVEHGHLGGKGSPVHHACVVGDTVGDPFKDTSGPSLNILIKVLAITSLVIAPFL
ncbi:MAG: K(+)-stimulated pyrophosphate-energized sodium pump [Planctomycetaceae bacterium]|jgi:K(+)-stimulated pyrophosphate-energized sodium pump